MTDARNHNPAYGEPDWLTGQLRLQEWVYVAARKRYKSDPEFQARANAATVAMQRGTWTPMQELYWLKATMLSMMHLHGCCPTAKRKLDRIGFLLGEIRAGHLDPNEARGGVRPV